MSLVIEHDNTSDVFPYPTKVVAASLNADVAKGIATGLYIAAIARSGEERLPPRTYTLQHNVAFVK